MLLEVLDEKPVACHAVAIDDDSVFRLVDRPAGVVTVVRTPYPCMVDDDIVRVDLKADLGLAWFASPAYAVDEIDEEDRIVDMTPFGLLPPNDDKALRRTLRIEDEPRDHDSVSVRAFKRRIAVLRNYRRLANAKDYCAWLRHLYGFGDAVDARSEEDVLSCGKRGVYRLRRVLAFLRHMEVARKVEDLSLAHSAVRLAIAPAHALRATANRRHEHLERVAVHKEKRLFADDRRFTNDSRAAACAPVRGNAFHASRRALGEHLPAVLAARGEIARTTDDDLVPVDSVDSGVEGVVAVEVLLLRIGAGGLLKNTVRNETARRPAIEPVEDGLARDIKAPCGSRLRYGPLEVEEGIGVVIGVDNLDILDADPEIARRVVLVERSGRLNVRELHVARGAAEPENLGVVADIDRLHLRVGAREEEERVALWSELALMLTLEYVFRHTVDIFKSVFRREHANILAKVWFWHGGSCNKRHHRKHCK